MVGIRHVCRRGITWTVLAIASIAVVGTMATSSPSGSDDPGKGKSGSLTVPVVSIAAQAANPGASDLVVHEWGTFLGMNASDGTGLDGMYHEEHALPSFVHSRSRDQLRLPIMLLKGETPVIFFYTSRPLRVRVGVGFREGIWTQWYPQAAVVRPSLLEQAQAPDRLKDGRICWFADVIPASQVPMQTHKRYGAAPCRPRSPCRRPAARHSGTTRGTSMRRSSRP